MPIKSWERKRMGQRFFDGDKEVILKVANRKFTWFQFVNQFGRKNFQAARRLDRRLRRLDPRGECKTVRQLAERIPFWKLYEYRRVGNISAYIFMKVLEMEGLNQDAWAGGPGRLTSLCAKARRDKKLVKGR